MSRFQRCSKISERRWDVRVVERRLSLFQDDYTQRRLVITFLHVQDVWLHYFCACSQHTTYIRVGVHTCNVTAYSNTVSWQCGRDSWPRNVSKVSYAVTLRACSVCCRYLAVASKGWYGYGRSRRGRATFLNEGATVIPNVKRLSLRFGSALQLPTDVVRLKY